MRSKKARLRDKSDRAMQEYIRANNNGCFVCGQPISCGHHYFPKSTASSLRYDLDNIIPLCQGCHFRHHNGDPRIHATVLEIKGIDWHKELLRKKNILVKPGIKYYEEIINKFK